MTNEPPIAKTDLETGPTGALYPTMSESPELRWSFIRRIYSIVAVQLLLTIAVATVVTLYHPIVNFLTTTRGGVVCFLLLFITPIIISWPLYHYRQRHPVNFVLLGIQTVSLAFVVGLACALTSGKMILESAILTTVVVMSLTLYTFWAAKSGSDFKFLGPFLFASLMVLLAFGLIQILYPLGSLSVMIYGCLSAIIFCAYLVYDTDNLIKRYTYDDYIWAAVSLYLDVINVFMAFLTVFSAADG
ncbi:hypothetical protein HanXRQr2_Chr10g0423771 [Helianthus annuus]|uniref:Putative bax inhibitor 1-related protein n=1 Tax=Helianthus annuus TaxID=4232 RepID=A0A251TFP8_HELAN|nr:protein LIFEGUARD 4 [Helianthus annuus]KAF5785027.1 hypothetical protein HanXRQr2_Chr10g0423771 [Helianthus annuus]KAJ0512635.1 hypothetical protein HanHA300_Chr10g0348401 [Helianthus annuus]KAJ0520224.1 hypothetical protein HanIR_Chr10g0457031 [Helianthus annuus]KAJ0528764.1 hypothetical protein HanHA89_Chr10g0370031 [Helianthus annuus]KAJ0695678.1 hypothetical protein HanLR1_Chr10g0348231 [Helianthus annuus]